MHFLQTIISNFQPLDDFPLDLGKLQVLNLEVAERRAEASEGLLRAARLFKHLAVTHQALQVAYLVLRLIQELVLVAFLFQQEERFPVKVKRSVSLRMKEDSFTLKIKKCSCTSVLCSYRITSLNTKKKKMIFDFRAGGPMRR